MYDDFLRMDLPAGTSIIGFADDALVVCAADDLRILELRINESLWRAKRWLDSRCLKMAPKKTEALLVTDPMWSRSDSAHAQHWWPQGS